MHSLPTTIRNFILKIRRSDETIKRRWVYLVSGIGILLVLLLWVGYLNLIIPKLSPPSETATAVTNTAPEQKEESGSFFGVLGRGFKKIGSDLGAGFSSIGDSFSKTYENAKQSFGGTKTDVQVESPTKESAPSALFFDLNATTSPTSSPLKP